jgi:hypothetical protein
MTNAGCFRARSDLNRFFLEAANCISAVSPDNGAE